MDTMHWQATYDGVVEIVVTAEYADYCEEWMLTVRFNGALDRFTSSVDPTVDGPALLADILARVDACDELEAALASHELG